MSPFAGRATLGHLTLKETVFKTAKRIGAFALVRDSEWRRQRLLILCYHGVSLRDEHEWNRALYVTPELLRARLRHLRERDYAILPLDDACRLLREGRLPPRSVALTFDDATVDFGEAALPVLVEFGAPATLYLSSYYISVRLPVFNTMLSYVLWKGRDSGGDIAAICASAAPLPVGTQAQRDGAYRAVCAYAAAGPLDAVAKDALVARIASHLGVNYDEVLASGVLQLMTAASVAALPPDLISVQLHTHRHWVPRDKRLFARELVENAAKIREMRGDADPLTHFSYPNGEYRGQLLPWLREFGVRFATTCVPGIASAQDEPLLLPRFVDSGGHSMTTFEAWASGFAALLPRRRIHRLDLRVLDTDASRTDEHAT
ncbi:MAG: polysaccharide deacetylase family protein [Acidobacteriota bacterium]